MELYGIATSSIAIPSYIATDQNSIPIIDDDHTYTNYEYSFPSEQATKQCSYTHAVQQRLMNSQPDYIASYCMIFILEL